MVFSSKHVKKKGKKMKLKGFLFSPLKIVYLFLFILYYGKFGSQNSCYGDNSKLLQTQRDLHESWPRFKSLIQARKNQFIRGNQLSPTDELCLVVCYSSCRMNFQLWKIIICDVWNTENVCCWVNLKGWKRVSPNNSFNEKITLFSCENEERQRCWIFGHCWITPFDHKI